MNSLFSNPAGTGQHIGARVAGVVLCSAFLLLAGCARVPLDPVPPAVVSLPQPALHALTHWELGVRGLAADVAAALKAGPGGAPLRIDTPEPSVFTDTVRDLLATQLHEQGVAVWRPGDPRATELRGPVLSLHTRLIPFGAGHIGAQSLSTAPPRHELVLTATLDAGGPPGLRRSLLFYAADADLALYLPARDRSVSLKVVGGLAGRMP